MDKGHWASTSTAVASLVDRRASDHNVMSTSRAPGTVLSEPKIWQLLAGSNLGRLVTLVDGRTEIFPVNFVVQERSVLFGTVVEGWRVQSEAPPSRYGQTPTLPTLSVRSCFRRSRSANRTTCASNRTRSPVGVSCSGQARGRARAVVMPAEPIGAQSVANTPLHEGRRGGMLARLVALGVVAFRAHQLWTGADRVDHVRR